MENPIKDNRIVKDITFATRFLSFVEDINVSDAFGEEEKEAMVSYANSLLKYQVRTAKDSYEIDYLKRIGVWNKYPKQELLTKDGYIIDLEVEDCTIYTCLKEQKIGDIVMKITCDKLRRGKAKIKKNRVYFKYEKNCSRYIEDNKLKYSEKDLERILGKKFDIIWKGAAYSQQR